VRWQVFGLTGSSRVAHSPTGRRFPGLGPVLEATVVPVHRCGAVLESHQVPSSATGLAGRPHQLRDKPTYRDLSRVAVPLGPLSPRPRDVIRTEGRDPRVV